MVERFQRDTRFQVQPANLAGAATEGTLIQRLQEFTSRRQQSLETTLGRRAAEAGAAAGAGQRATPLRREGTIRGDAFNRAALTANAAAISTDIRDTVTRLESTNDADPEAFQAALQGYQEGLLGEVNPQLRPLVIEDIANRAGPAGNRIVERSRALQRTENFAVIEGELDGLRTDALNAAREGDEEALQIAKEKHLLLLTANSTPDENGDVLIDAVSRERKLRELEKEIDANTVLGTFERVLDSEGVDGGEAALANFEADTEVDLPPEIKDQLANRMGALLNQARQEENRIAAAARAEQTAKADLAVAQMKDFIEVNEAGFSGDLEPVIEALDGVDLGSLSPAKQREVVSNAGRIAEAQEFQPTVNALSQLTRRERENVLNAREGKLRAGTPSVKDVRLQQLLQKRSDNMNRELNNDPLSFAASEGVIELAPLDLTSPERVSTSLQSRLAQAATASAHFGEAVAPLTRAETRQLSNVMDEGSLETRLALAGAIVDGAGDQAIEVFAMLDKENATADAVAGALLLEGAPDAAEHALRGIDVRKNLPDALPRGAGKTEFNAQLNDILGDAYIVDDGNSKQRDAAEEGITNIYASLSARAGDLNQDDVNTKRLQTAVDLFSGGILEFNGHNLPAPQREMSQRDFDRWIDGLTPADIDLMGGVAGFTSEEALKALRERGKLTPVGKGRYIVNTNSARDGRELFFHLPDGGEFELTFGVTAAGLVAP